MLRVGDLYPVWWDTGDGRPAGDHNARILAIRPYDGPIEGLTHILKLTLPGSKRGWTEMSVAAEVEDVQYRLGNCLRGHFEGYFQTMEEAWEVLSQRFLLSYPVTPNSKGRHVQMYVFEENRHGFHEWVLCKDENTHLGGALTREELLERCKKCHHQ